MSMKRFTVFASFLLLAASLSVAETPVERYGQLAVNGNRLVSVKTGQPVQLRGMSFYWSMASAARDYYNADVVNWLADDWKANVVRAAMGVEDKFGTPAEKAMGYLVGDQSGDKSNKDRVFDVAEAAIAKGIYVIIDWHSHLAYERTDGAKQFFEEMAAKYKNTPNVIYEIFNEPKQDPNGAKSPAFWENTVKPYSQTIVDAIRAIDPNNVIIIGTPTWSQDVDVAAANPVTGDNLVYALHFYSATHKAALRTKATTAMNNSNNKGAIFVSEFGVCDASGNGTIDLTESTTWLDFLDANKVSWVNWSICKLNEAASALKPTASIAGNWTADQLTTSGTYIRNKLIAAHQREEEAWATATLVTDLVIPNTPKTTESAAIAPVAAVSNNFSVGPVPASRSADAVKFFWQGKPIIGGSLFIYDALGNSVKNISINDASSGNLSKRAIGSWDLTDAKGRRVTAGSYLVKGKVTTQSGNAANISSIVVVGN